MYFPSFTISTLLSYFFSFLSSSVFAWIPWGNFGSSSSSIFQLLRRKLEHSYSAHAPINWFWARLTQHRYGLDYGMFKIPFTQWLEETFWVRIYSGYWVCFYSWNKYNLLLFTFKEFSQGESEKEMEKEK